MNELQDNHNIDADDTAADTTQGLSEQEIKLLLRVKFKTSDVTKKSYETDKSCMICLCDYEEGDTLLSLGCKHNFHESCAVSWLRANARCPLCNAPPFELQVPPIAHIAIDM
ncbi:hypothetical protein EV183_003960 [Coemansia sp. RSA 2336]|nr:hypothetical protein EV183_003960 [Coemansia sp. RSA 2336]